jgi:hypothetical protein
MKLNITLPTMITGAALIAARAALPDNEGLLSGSPMNHSCNTGICSRRNAVGRLRTNGGAVAQQCCATPFTRFAQASRSNQSPCDGHKSSADYAAAMECACSESDLSTRPERQVPHLADGVSCRAGA